MSYVQHLTSESDLWLVYPGNLRTPAEAWKYVSLWWDLIESLEGVTELTAAQKDLIVVCSFCALPEPPPGALKRPLPKLESLSHYLESPSDWGSKIKETAVGFFAVPARHYPSNATVLPLLDLAEQATGVGYCRHCLHAQPRCHCPRASGEAPEPASSTAPVYTSASAGPSASISTAGSTAVVTPISSLIGTTTYRDRDDVREVWRAQTDDLRRRSRRLHEEAEKDWLEYQQAFFGYQQAKALAAQWALPPLRLGGPPSTAPSAALGRPPVEASTVAADAVQPPPPQVLAAQPPSVQPPAVPSPTAQLSALQQSLLQLSAVRLPLP